MPKFGKKSKRLDYYEAFDRQAAIAVKEIKAVQEALKDYEGAEALEGALAAVHEIEHEGDVVCHEIWDAILPDFITPIDREDIITTARLVDDLVDRIEEILQEFYLYDVKSLHPEVENFLDIIHKECEALVVAVDCFKNVKRGREAFQEAIDAVYAAEDEADELYMRVIRGLYTDPEAKPIYCYMWTQIFETLEDCCDTGEEIADFLHAVMLKQG